MSLVNSREGTPLGFSSYPRRSDEGTLGNPETIVWSSIRHLSSREMAVSVAYEVHSVKKKTELQAVAKNLKLFIGQAYEFYEAAKSAKPNTAPLIYYYSFLNLAKALCEIRKPGFHKRDDYYNHGIRWKNDRNLLVNIDKECVHIPTRRGVWHALMESILGQGFSITTPQKLSIKELFLNCPEISIETSRSFARDSNYIELVNPQILIDKESSEVWTQFSVYIAELRDKKLSAPTLIKSISTNNSSYKEVRALEKYLRTFESAAPKTFKADMPYRAIFPDIKEMNLFTHLDREKKLGYLIPLQQRLPFRMPQLMVLYTILFWLGSLVRYDPHSVSDLMESRHWVLIDGFMSQSRLWLLEQFEWAFFQAETTLWSAR